MQGKTKVMMDRQKGKIVFECDACDTVLETGEGDFDAAREKFKEAEWKAVMMGKVMHPIWEHYCPDCKESVA
jgi:hypothetical protein